MKRVLLFFTLIVTSIIISYGAGNSKNPVGKWNFTATGAPYEYEKGTFEISQDSERYLVFILFEGSDYRIPCEKVLFDGEKLSFSLYLDIDEIQIKLTFETEDLMVGAADSPDGAIPLSLTRVKATK